MSITTNDLALRAALELSRPHQPNPCPLCRATWSHMAGASVLLHAGWCAFSVADATAPSRFAAAHIEPAGPFHALDGLAVAQLVTLPASAFRLAVPGHLADYAFVPPLPVEMFFAYESRFPIYEWRSA